MDVRDRERAVMRWDVRLQALFEDLEQQAAGLSLADRDSEVAELRRAEYAGVDLAGRLRASVGARLVVEVTGVGTVEGELHRVGEGWLLLGAAAQDWVVVTRALGSLKGLADRVAVEPAPVEGRLGLGSALRGLAVARAEVVVHRADGRSTRGALGRVGADFMEVSDAGLRGQLPAEAVPFSAIAAVRSC
jgi:hypothetical protein